MIEYDFSNLKTSQPEKKSKQFRKEMKINDDVELSTSDGHLNVKLIEDKGDRVVIQLEVNKSQIYPKND